jgi:hypothetical protein
VFSELEKEKHQRRSSSEELSFKNSPTTTITHTMNNDTEKNPLLVSTAVTPTLQEEDTTGVVEDQLQTSNSSIMDVLQNLNEDPKSQASIFLRSKR